MLNVQCNRNELHEAVQTVSRGVTGRSTQPVQNNVLLEAADGVLRLVATDLEYLSIEAELPVQVIEEGAVTAPARVLAELTGNLPDAEVALVADEHQALSVSCGGSHEVIRGLSATDFQRFPPIGESLEAQLPQGLLHNIVRQTVFATSRDETRPILTGALMEISADGLKVVATDTYRLAVRTAQVETGASASRSAIVSSRTLGELVRILSADSQEPAQVFLSDNQIEFRVGKTILSARLIEGQFPNYQKVVPESYERRVTVAISDLEPALRRALIVAREDANRTVFCPGPEALQIRAESPDVGRVEEQVPATLEGDGIEIAFNARYILDVLEAIPTDRITLDLSGGLNPGMLRPEGDDSYLYVLMPMQIM
jgi:DNA polymerase-3 subunit beta